MKTFIIDWGAGARGGRYGLIQEKTLDDAVFYADSIGWPFKIGELKIPEYGGVRYVDIDAPKNPFHGVKLSDIKTKKAVSWIKDPQQ